jgi:hypothetical protein
LSYVQQRLSVVYLISDIQEKITGQFTDAHREDVNVISDEQLAQTVWVII